MKFIAVILIISMGFLGLNRFVVALDWMQPQTELSCSVDCCADAEVCCCGNMENGDNQENEEMTRKLKMTRRLKTNVRVIATAPIPFRL